MWRPVQPVRMDISQYSVWQQKPRRAAACQQLTNVGCRNRQWRLIDKGDLAGSTLDGLRVGSAASGNQVAQHFGGFFIGVRALQDDNMAIIE